MVSGAGPALLEIVGSEVSTGDWDRDGKIGLSWIASCLGAARAWAFALPRLNRAIGFLFSLAAYDQPGLFPGYNW